MGLNVIFVSSEAVPFAKTGGLADVAGALPPALKGLGMDVSLFMPLYREVKACGARLEDTGIEFDVPVGTHTAKAGVFKSSSAGVDVYFIKRDEYFDRAHLYGTPDGDYRDNMERFLFFSRAVIEAVKRLGIRPDVMHLNDWQTALIAAYLKDTYGRDPWFSDTATVFTIHNIAYQGVFPEHFFGLTNLDRGLFSIDGLEYWGNVNLLKAGMAFSGLITTVSESYSREIQTPEYGCGLDGVLRERKNALFGVLNGADYSVWDPEKDPLIPYNYSVGDLRGKAMCKRRLLKEYGLDAEPGTPLVGMISRLAEQKGFDMLAEAMDDVMALGVRMALLGSGDRKYNLLFEGLAERFPGRLGVRIGYDDRLAHLIEAGADMFLIPSRYEPCGLNQIYSLKYGTVPIVRATGGLNDTIRDVAEADPNGFKFKEYSAQALVGKLGEAASMFRGDRKAWRGLQRRAMQEDFSWKRSAKRYAELYATARTLLPKT